jgi:hypothetical protein
LREWKAPASPVANSRGLLLQPSAIFARLNFRCKWVPGAKKRMEIADAMWDDNSMISLSKNLQNRYDC